MRWMEKSPRLLFRFDPIFRGRERLFFDLCTGMTLHMHNTTTEERARDPLHGDHLLGPIDVSGEFLEKN